MVFQALIVPLLPSTPGELLLVPFRADLADPTQCRKAFERSKSVAVLISRWQGLMMSIRSLACRMLLTGDTTLRRGAAVWPEVHPLEFLLPWREPMPLPAAVLTNRLIVMPFFLLRFPLPMMPSNMQDDILSHLCKLGILLVPNETPEIA